MKKTEEKESAAAVAELQPAEANLVSKEKSTSEDYFADFDFSSLKPDLEPMLKAGVHFGHQKSRKDPNMDQYIFTNRKGVSIIDLQKTLEKLEEAMKFLKDVKGTGKQILFVGTKKQVVGIVKSAAKKTNMPFVVSRWLGGTFTNFKVIRGRTRYLKDGQVKMEKGEFNIYTKFERTKKAEELEKLEEKMGGIKDMTELPAALIVTDIKEDGLAIKEAKKAGIPVVAIADTNCDPSVVDYPIPGNDDAVSSVRLLLAYLCKALAEKPMTDNAQLATDNKKLATNN